MKSVIFLNESYMSDIKTLKIQFISIYFCMVIHYSVGVGVCVCVCVGVCVCVCVCVFHSTEFIFLTFLKIFMPFCKVTTKKCFKKQNLNIFYSF